MRTTLALDDDLIAEAQALTGLKEKTALVREARSQFFPTLSAGPSYSRSQSSSNLGSGAIASNESGKQAQVFSLPGEVSWAPDLWDKVRNTVRSAQYTAQVSAAAITELSGVPCSSEARRFVLLLDLSARTAREG